MTSSQKLPIPFLLGITALALIFFAMCLVAASHESFIRDDFAFLAYVQRPHWSWAEVYLPIDARWWWAYRPLGMETFFYVCFQLFGLQAFGYYCVAIGLHFATGWLSYRLMLRLGFEPRIAAVGALLGISRYPTMHDIFYGSVFHYTAAIFFCLIAINAFLDYARLGARKYQAASWASFFLALLCNEFAVMLPFVLLLFFLYDGKFALSRDVLTSAAAKTAPQFALAGLYLFYRFRVIAEVEANHAYVQSLDPGLVIHNLGRQLYLLFGDSLSMWTAIALMLGSLGMAARKPAGRELLRSWFAPLSIVLCGWVLALMAPFTVLMVTHSRFSKPIEAPACILFAAGLHVVWQLYGEQRTRLLEGALLLLVLIALPSAPLVERYREPQGVHGQALAEAVREAAPDIAPRTRVVLIYNAPGLASHAGGAKFKREVFGGTAALQAYFSDKMLRLELHDLWQARVEPGCSDCLYLQLMPDLGVEGAELRHLRFRTPYPQEAERQRRSGRAP